MLRTKNASSEIRQTYQYKLHHPDCTVQHNVHHNMHVVVQALTTTREVAA